VRCRPRRGTHGCMAEPGSSPWAAASTAPAVGWRERVGMHGGVVRATENAAFLPPSDRARIPQDHGGAAVLGMAASGGVGSKKGQRPGLAFKATAHACWGARLRAPRPTRVRACGHARDTDATRAHRHGAAATKRWRRPTARGVRPSGWRARRRRRRHLQKIATQPGSMAGITSSGAATPWHGTFLLGSKAVASTWEKKRRPHLGGHWPRRRRR
jgi:hypothetical protein